MPLGFAVKSVALMMIACLERWLCSDDEYNLRPRPDAMRRLVSVGVEVVLGVLSAVLQDVEAACRKGVARGALASVFCHFHFGLSP